MVFYGIKESHKKWKFIKYKTLIKSSLLYGAETWGLMERYAKKVEAVEMDAIRRSLRISRRERIRNKTVREQMCIQGTIKEDIEQRQLVWNGHVNQINDERLPQQILEWQP